MTGPLTEASKKQCGTCALFKRTFPTSPRLREIGNCQWKPPVKLPEAFAKRTMKEGWGQQCELWQAKTD